MTTHHHTPKDNSSDDIDNELKGLPHTVSSINFEDLPDSFTLEEMKETDLTWILDDDHVLHVFLLDDDRRVERFFSLTNLIASLEPLLETETIDLQVVTVRCGEIGPSSIRVSSDEL